MNLQKANKYEQSATDCLDDLISIEGAKVASSVKFPKNPRALSSKLRRMEPFLHQKGLKIEFWRDSGLMRKRMITVTKINATANPKSKAPAAMVSADESTAQLKTVIASAPTGTDVE